MLTPKITISPSRVPDKQRPAMPHLFGHSHSIQVALRSINERPERQKKSNKIFSRFHFSFDGSLLLRFSLFFVSCHWSTKWRWTCRTATWTKQKEEESETERQQRRRLIFSSITPYSGRLEMENNWQDKDDEKWTRTAETTTYGRQLTHAAGTFLISFSFVWFKGAFLLRDRIETGCRRWHTHTSWSHLSTPNDQSTYLCIEWQFFIVECLAERKVRENHVNSVRISVSVQFVNTCVRTPPYSME